MSGTIASPSTRRNVIAAALLTLMMAFYFWTSTTSQWRATPGPALGFYYDHLSNAFLAGQLSLLIPPDPRLLALPDPYDPVANEGLRLHDAVLFHGKYYLYYGPVPALLLYLPFRWITGLDFSDPLAVALFCSLGLLFALRLLRLLARRYVPETPNWLLLAAIPALGFGSVMPFLLRRPLHYEVAIAAGQAFALASMYYFVAGSIGERVRIGALAGGSLLLGLAAGSRMPMLAAGLIPLVLVTWLWLSGRASSFSARVRIVFAAFGPLAVCVGALGVYNYLRFGSWTEFGVRYTLQGWQSARTYQFYSVSRAVPGFFYYVLAPPRLTADFPYLWLNPQHYLTPPADYYLEPVAGILPCIPLLGILLLAPLWGRAAVRRENVPLWAIGTALVVVGVVLLTQFALAAGTMRYEVDFVLFLLIPALLLWFGGVTGLRGGIARRLAVFTFAALLGITIVCQAAFSIVGYQNNLLRGSPQQYEAIHDFFRPIERWLQ